MPLKTVVKVGNISNLSDARYCAGMGVDMLGFSVIEGQEHYISPQLFQEIRGWVSGPKIVAEVYGLSSPQQLASIIENFAPDYLELTADEFRRFRTDISLPCIVKGSPENSDAKIAYFLVDKFDVKALANKSNLLVLTTSTTSLSEILSTHNAAGIALNGSPEVRPGFKDYSELAEILEKLDEE